MVQSRQSPLPARGEAPDPRPWYRQLWPWLLMLMPALAVVSGSVTWWLAATTNNSMVVDDYYREGRAINQQIARDIEASRLGLRAEVGTDAGQVHVQLAARPGAAPIWPDKLSLRLVHATESSLDAGLQLMHQGNGQYRAPGALPAAGHWFVHLEEPDGHWRLVARAQGFDSPLTIEADQKLTGDSR